MVVDQRRSSRVFIARAIPALGRVYPSSIEALAQPVENEADAGAKKIWVVLEPGRVTVVGDGSGMIPYMLDEDHQRMEDFFEASQRGELQGYDLESVIPSDSSSRRSLEWMMECIALSAKKPGEKGTRGMRGIGSLAYLQYATDATVITQPLPELGTGYWGGKVDPRYSNPPLKLVAFSAESLSRGDATYTIDISEVPLTDPWGKPITHGTRVEITGIRQGEEDISKPGSVASYFRSRFGDDIKQGRYELTIVDRVSEDARKTGEKLIRILPTVYKGIPLVDEEVAVRPGVTFAISIWFDPNGRNLSPMVRHKGSEKFELTKLQSFHQDPWNTGKLWGYVDFPTYPNEEELWDTSKTMLLPTQQRRQWEQAVARYARQIEAQIEEILQRFKERGFKELASDIASATADAMSEVEAFREQNIPGLTPPRTRKTPAPRTAPVTVEASVLNEHNRGVAGIQVELYLQGKLIMKRSTGLSGHVSLGKHEYSRGYRLRIELPNGVILLEPQEYPFDLKENIREGIRAVFRIVTNEPKPDSPKISSKFTMEFTPLDDPLRPWEQWLHVGLIRYNSAHPELSDAFDQNDEERKAALLAQYTSGAVTEFCIRGELPYVLMQQSLLYIQIYKHLREHQAERKRKLALAKRRK